MKFYDIPGLTNKVSQLVIGTDYFTPEIYDRVSDMLDRYFALGGNVIDTAYIYAGGKSELTIGRWMEERANRDQVVLLTKGAHHDERGPRVNREAILSDLHESLERLRTDCVDLYALHRDDPEVPVGEIVEILHEQVEKGTIRAFGGSNWTTARLEEANQYAKQHGLTGFRFSSPNLSLAKAKEPYWPGCVSADDDTLAWHERTQMPLFSWSSQARGFFTGKFTREDRSNEDLVRVFYNDANWDRYDRASEMAKQKNVSTIQIALAYVLNQSFPACALIGPQNQEELESCFAAAEIRLTPEEVKWLEHGATNK